MEFVMNCTLSSCVDSSSPWGIRVLCLFYLFIFLKDVIFSFLYFVLYTIFFKFNRILQYTIFIVIVFLDRFLIFVSVVCKLVCIHQNSTNHFLEIQYQIHVKQTHRFSEKFVPNETRLTDPEKWVIPSFTRYFQSSKMHEVSFFRREYFLFSPYSFNLAYM